MAFAASRCAPRSRSSSSPSPESRSAAISRKWSTWSARIPAEQFVLDGELAIPIGDTLSFEALQMRLHPAESRVRKLAAETPAMLMLFDVLSVPGNEHVLAKPLTERRAALEAFHAGIRDEPALRLSPMTRDRKEAERWLREAQGGLDGVIAKRLDEPYRPGERAMLKVKRLRSADCVVGGFRYASNSRLVGSLLLGLYNDRGELDHVGFTSAISEWRSRRADPKTRGAPRAAWFHRQGAGRTEPLVDRTHRRVGAASPDAGGGGALRPRDGQSLSAWHEAPALAARQGAAAMHVRPAAAGLRGRMSSLPRWVKLGRMRIAPPNWQAVCICRFEGGAAPEFASRRASTTSAAPPSPPPARSAPFRECRGKPDERQELAALGEATHVTNRCCSNHRQVAHEIRA